MKYCIQNANGRWIIRDAECRTKTNRINQLQKFIFVSSIKAFNASILAILVFELNGVACNQLIPAGRYLNIIKIHWSNLFHIIAHEMVQKNNNDWARSLSFFLSFVFEYGDRFQNQFFKSQCEITKCDNNSDSFFDIIRHHYECM